MTKIISILMEIKFYKIKFTQINVKEAFKYLTVEIRG
jgi:hypothetical protein